MKLVNTATRPVELHLATGVVVVGAQQSIDCADEDLAVGQVVELCRRGILVAHDTPPDDAAPPAPKKAFASAKSSPQPRGRTATRRRRTP